MYGDVFMKEYIAAQDGDPAAIDRVFRLTISLVDHAAHVAVVALLRKRGWTQLHATSGQLSSFGARRGGRGGERASGRRDAQSPGQPPSLNVGALPERGQASRTEPRAGPGINQYKVHIIIPCRGHNDRWNYPDIVSAWWVKPRFGPSFGAVFCNFRMPVLRAP